MKYKKPVGKLTHAPLVLTVAALQIQQVMSFDDYIPKIQDALRDQYPGTGKIQQQVTQVTAVDTSAPKVTQRTTTRLLMSSPDRLWLAHANEDVISLMTTANYQDFDEFEARFQQVIRVVCDVMRIKFFTRLGFRQIDNITDFNGLALSKQIESSIQMPATALDFPMGEARVESTYKTGEGVLVLRCIQIPQLVTVPLLPIDFKEVSSFVDSPVKERQVDGVVVLDIDHYKHYPNLTLYNESEVLSSLRQLHGASRDMFFNCVTDQAIQAWR